LRVLILLILLWMLWRVLVWLAPILLLLRCRLTVRRW